MKDAIQAAIAQRLGELADVAFRLKPAVEAGAPACPPWLLIRAGLDADSAAVLLQGHVEKLAPNKGDTKSVR